MLDEDPGVSPPPRPVGNIRVMVPTVDDYWTLCRRPGLTASARASPVASRCSAGLRR